MNCQSKSPFINKNEYFGKYALNFTLLSGEVTFHSVDSISVEEVIFWKCFPAEGCI